MELGVPNRKYHVQELSDGFLIGGPNRSQVHVKLCSTHFRLWCPHIPLRIGLIEYRRLVDCIAWELMRDWTPPRHDRRPFPGIKRWAVGKTRRAIAGLVYEQWRRQLNRLDKKVVGVQKTIFAATMGTASIALHDQFYRDRFLVADVMRFRAAAIAARHIYLLAESKRRNQILLSPRVLELREMVEQLGGRTEITIDSDEIDQTAALNFLNQWPDLFSEGDAYTSLRRTLMNLPGGIPCGLLLNLPQIHLKRPVFRRLELMVILLAAEQLNHVNEKVFHFASEDRIRAAMQIVGRSIGCRFSTRLTRHIAEFVSVLAEYPELHHGNIVGLAEKVVKSNRDRAAKRIEKVIQAFGQDVQLRRPPIALPEKSGIRLLETPAEICEEGIRMGHCVELLIHYAIEGDAFIFHVEKYGESATVHVNARGRVVQARGPLNESNRACNWATRILRQWGLAISEPVTSAQVDYVDIDPGEQAELDELPF